MIDERAAPTSQEVKSSGSGRLKVENFDEIADQAPPAPAQRSAAADAGVPVNSSSRAVNPRKQFPLHADFLLRDLFNRGEAPEDWQIVAAEEVRLDEMNMDVEFTLVNERTKAAIRRVVEVQAGKLSRIRDR